MFDSSYFIVRCKIIFLFLIFFNKTFVGLLGKGWKVKRLTQGSHILLTKYNSKPSGPGAHTLLRQYEFESRLRQQFLLCKNCLKNGNKQKQVPLKKRWVWIPGKSSTMIIFLPVRTSCTVWLAPGPLAPLHRLRLRFSECDLKIRTIISLFFVNGLNRQPIKVDQRPTNQQFAF